MPLAHELGAASEADAARARTVQLLEGRVASLKRRSAPTSTTRGRAAAGCRPSRETERELKEAQAQLGRALCGPARDGAASRHRAPCRDRDAGGGAPALSGDQYHGAAHPRRATSDGPASGKCSAPPCRPLGRPPPKRRRLCRRPTRPCPSPRPGSQRCSRLGAADRCCPVATAAQSHPGRASARALEARLHWTAIPGASGRKDRWSLRALSPCVPDRGQAALLIHPQGAACPGGERSASCL